jgi:hypothetical protein
MDGVGGWASVRAGEAASGASSGEGVSRWWQFLDGRLKLTRSRALVVAQKIADNRQSRIWVRELGRGKWVMSDSQCGYYQSTEFEVLPLRRKGKSVELVY